MDLKEQIRNEVISARILAKTVDEAVDAILILSGVVVTFCRCKEKTKAYIDYSIDKKVCSKCKEVIKAVTIPAVVNSGCKHNWHHLDNHSDRMICVKCDKRI